MSDFVEGILCFAPMAACVVVVAGVEGGAIALPTLPWWAMPLIVAAPLVVLAFLFDGLARELEGMGR